MKILLLSDSTSPHTTLWVTELLRAGLEIALFSMHSEQSEEVDRLSADQAIHFFGGRGMAGDTSLSSIPFQVIRCKRAIRTFRPDILHAHYASSYGLVGALSGFRPYLISVWGSDVYDFPSKSIVNRKILEYNLSKCSTILSTSRAMWEQTRKFTDRPIEVVPFGVDRTVFRPSSKENEGGMVIGTSKRLAHIYGIDLLLRAFALLVMQSDQNDLLRLQIVGGGEEEEALKTLSRELSIDAQVDFKGELPHSEVAEFMRGLDIFAALSREESFGVAIIEAMSCGLPVVVSDAPGPEEIVTDGHDGFIVPINDHGRAAERLAMLVGDAVLRKRLGENAVATVVEKYERKENVARMVEVYRRTRPQDQHE